jgi:hypothetical protein
MWPKPKDLPSLKTIRYTPQFVLRYHPECLMTPIAARYVQIEMHPLRPKILHLYGNKDPNTLWWRVSTGHLPLRRVVRSWIARRARAAFREALRVRGFQSDGRPLVGSDVKGQRGSRQLTGLVGTADIHLNMRTTRAEDSEVQREMLSLVDSLRSHARRT